MYKVIEILKKNGDKRKIYIPNEELKKKQKEILKKFNDIYFANDEVRRKLMYCYSFKKNTSIYNNALQHIGKKYILKIDLKDFFSTCTTNNASVFVREVLSMAKVNPDDVYYNKFLPQGASTSPFISNLYLAEFDCEFVALLRTHFSDDVVYTRYADDIVISSNSKAIFSKTLFNILSKKLGEIGFKINYDKIKKLTRSSPMRVTGYVLNSGKPTISRKERRLIRAIIHNATKTKTISKTDYHSVLGFLAFCQQAHPEWVNKCKKQLSGLKII
jgi:RNA-directed DNA polymerase